MQTPDAVVLEALLHAAPDAVLISDEQGRIVIASDQVREMFRCEPGALLGHPVESLLPQKLRRVHEGHRANYYTAPSTRPMGRGLDLVAVRTDGSEFPAEISLSHIKTEHGLLVMAIVRDVTDRKRSQASLEDEHQRLETLIDLSPVGIIVVAGDGRVALVNQEAERLMGFRSRAGDRLSRYENAFVYRRPDGSQYLPEELPLQRALNQGERVSAENVVLVARDGKTTPTLMDATPIFSLDGNVDGAMAVVQDITPLAEVDRLKEELARLEERERMEMDLHDEVVGAIYATMLQFEWYMDEHQESSPDVAQVMNDSIERLQKVIANIRNHILDRPTRAPANRGLRAGLVQLATDFHATTGIVAYVEGEEDFDLVDSQFSAARHVVMEALNNAAKHSQASKVVVRLFSESDAVKVEVHDDGIGFELREADGSGHGVRNMTERARQAGGTLVVQSKPGDGTRIVLGLPTSAS